MTTAKDKIWKRTHGPIPKRNEDTKILVDMTRREPFKSSKSTKRKYSAVIGLILGRPAKA